jgi:hypothetical protein
MVWDSTVSNEEPGGFVVLLWWGDRENDRLDQEVLCSVPQCLHCRRRQLLIHLTNDPTKMATTIH